MSYGQWIVAGFSVVAVGYLLLFFVIRIQKNGGKSTDLGLEATDLETFKKSMAENEARARKTGAGGKHYSWTETETARNRPIK